MIRKFNLHHLPLLKAKLIQPLSFEPDLRNPDAAMQAIEKLENGKVNPTLYTLLEIVNALEVSLDKLVDLD